LALTYSSLKALQHYIGKCKISGVHKITISNAVILTSEQCRNITFLLAKYWTNDDYICPTVLDIKPHHGYCSRVEKDGFTPEQYLEWLVAGCSDVATVSSDTIGRPFLLLNVAGDDVLKMPFQIQVPIRSDMKGYVHIDGVIPHGIAPKKKQPPRRVP
jgi:hypothetical protein